MIKKSFFIYFLISNLSFLPHGFLNDQQCLKEELGRFMYQGDFRRLVKIVLDAKASGIEDGVLREIFSSRGFLESFQQVPVGKKVSFEELLSLLRQLGVERCAIEALESKIEQEQPVLDTEEELVEEKEPLPVSVDDGELIQILMDENKSRRLSELKEDSFGKKILYGIMALAVIALIMQTKKEVHNNSCFTKRFC